MSPRLVSFVVLLLATTTAFAQTRYDLVIKNGRVIDGSGNPWYDADVAVRDGKIAAIRWARERKVRFFLAGSRPGEFFYNRSRFLFSRQQRLPKPRGFHLIFQKANQRSSGTLRNTAV